MGDADVFPFQVTKKNGTTKVKPDGKGRTSEKLLRKYSNRQKRKGNVVAFLGNEQDNFKAAAQEVEQELTAKHQKKRQAGLTRNQAKFYGDADRLRRKSTDRLTKKITPILDLNERLVAHTALPLGWTQHVDKTNGKT